MRTRIAIVAGLLAAVAAAILVPVIASGDDTERAMPRMIPGLPGVEIVTPRNGARQAAHAVVVKVKIRNFRLSPRHFAGEPLLGEGHLRFSLNRVPDCVEPTKLERAESSPVGKGRLIGASFDFPRYSGPNGVLAERVGSQGSYSPATRPEIYYHELPAGFYRLVITLARNDGSPTPFHAVTNFQILPRPGHGPKCTGGKVSSAKAAAFR